MIKRKIDLWSPILQAPSLEEITLQFNKYNKSPLPTHTPPFIFLFSFFHPYLLWKPFWSAYRTSINHKQSMGAAEFCQNSPLQTHISQGNSKYNKVIKGKDAAVAEHKISSVTTEWYLVTQQVTVKKQFVLNLTRYQCHGSYHFSWC